MKITLRVKMVVSFLLILAVSCMVTFFGAVAISNNSIMEEIKAGQFSYADTLIALQNQTNLTPQDILDVNINSIYNTRLLDNLDKKQLDDEIRSRLENGEKVYLFNHRLFASPSTLINLNSETVKVSLRKQDVFGAFRLRIALILLSILVLSCVILALTSTRMLRPILKLNEAAQRVAAGDFSVSVDEKSKDEIGILIRNFNRMARELGSMEYLQKDFIRNVSHEFKTPLASIQGFARLLQDETLSPQERREFSRIILEESERLSRLSSNILKLSKLEHQSGRSSEKEFFLDEQIRSVIVMLEPEWSKREIQFEVHMEKTVCRGDEELLQQVWINLIENAVKYSGHCGRITIRIQQTDEFLDVEISDQGIGMDEETKNRIFERFYQGNESHSAEGSGLGLSIAKRIIDLSKGEIHVESSPGRGSTFLVRLPRRF